MSPESSELTFDQTALLEKYSPVFAFAYGSGVFRQEGYKKDEKPMIDMVFGVEDGRTWHKNNLRKNSADYPLNAKVLRARFLNWLQEKGAKISYQTYIHFRDQKIKYGVINQKSLIYDLLNWETLYVAGRLHKPVHVMKSTEEIDQAMQTNFENALRVALLMLPENFTEHQLFMTIAGFSYTGDARMKLGENANKVSNIVTANAEGFSELYAKIINADQNLERLNDGKLQQCKSPQTTEDRFSRIPKNLNRTTETPSNFEDLPQMQEALNQGIEKIVKPPSRTQIIKGIITSGVVKAVIYALAKLKKKRQGKKQKKQHLIANTNASKQKLDSL